MALPSLAPLDVGGDAADDSVTACLYDDGQVSLAGRDGLLKDSNLVGDVTGSLPTLDACVMPLDSALRYLERGTGFECLLSS